MGVSPQETRKRKREKWVLVVISTLIAIIFTAEIIISKRSTTLPFSESVLLFSLVNFNLLLILVLVFFAIRNFTKFFFEGKVLGRNSSLRKRLVLAFTLFATVPTILLSSISAYYVHQSFERWFSQHIVNSFKQSLQITQAYYDESHKRAEHWANVLHKQYVIDYDSFRNHKQEEVAKVLDDSIRQLNLEWVEIHYSFPPKKITRWKKGLQADSALSLSHEEILEVRKSGSARLITPVAHGELSRVTVGAGAKKLPPYGFSGKYYSTNYF